MLIYICRSLYLLIFSFSLPRMLASSGTDMTVIRHVFSCFLCSITWSLLDGIDIALIMGTSHIRTASLLLITLSALMFIIGTYPLSADSIPYIFLPVDIWSNFIVSVPIFRPLSVIQPALHDLYVIMFQNMFLVIPYYYYSVFGLG